MPFLAGFDIRIALWIAREPRKSQKEGQEDRGILKQIEGGSPRAFLPFHRPPGRPHGSSWAPWQSIKGPYKAVKGLIRP